jgi:hypothetical protein
MSNPEFEIVPSATEINLQPHEHLQITPFESGLIKFLGEFRLPQSGIFAEISERRVTLSNLNTVVSRIPISERGGSIYLSKYVVAAAAGLFDAALNYLWDETILQLRTRVAQYDLSYFFDNAVASEERRNKLKDAADLDKITDDELIRGAHVIGLIGDIGFRHLDYIRYMRNWVSAAHPNQNEITGLQLLSWLETCVKEVITLPLSNATVEIKRLLESIKHEAIDDPTAKEIAVFFTSLTTDQVDSLAAGFFGIFVRGDSLQQSRTNILKLFPTIWPRCSEVTRQGFGIKYGRFSASNDQASKSLAHQILSHVGGLAYIPDDIKAVQVEDILDRLVGVHNGLNNFYNEPPYARQLEALVGAHGSVPKQVTEKYVRTLVYLFLTKGNGTAWNAEPIYLKLIDQFDFHQMTLAVLSYQDVQIASRLQFSLCRTKLGELLKRLRAKASLPALTEAIDFLLNHTAPPDKWRVDSTVKNKIVAVAPLLTPPK